MALVLKDRVRETTTVLGTNDATLLGAVTGFQSFAVVGSANTCYYCIADQSGGNWEVGIGTYSSVGPTLARTTILSSSNSGSIVSFPAGTKDVFLTYPSEKAVFEDASGNVSLPADLTVVGAVNAGSINATTIDLTNIEVTNIKAKDGTQSIALADSTGVATFSANPVISSGTANGVLYLNGSNSATSGSGFVFDGTNLGIGTSTPNSPLTVNLNPSPITGLQLNPAPGISIIGQGSCGVTLDTFASNSQFTFRRANGTITSPTATQSGDILGAITARGYGATGYSNANRGLIQIVAAENWTDTAQGTYWQFNTVATGTATSSEKMRLDSSGNLGLGVTPSAWSGGGNLDLGSSASVNSSNTVINIGANWYYNSGYKYKGTGAATQYQQYSGSHTWYTAPSGTAGNAITFTQAMTLDASGNVNIGTSGTGYRLDVSSVGSAASETALRIFNPYTSGTAVASTNMLFGYHVGGSYRTAAKIEAGQQSAGTFGFGYLAFSTQNTDGTVAEAMRIDSSGNVGIGTSSPSYKLDVIGAVKAGTLQASGSAVGSFSANSWFVQNEGSSTNRMYYCGADTSTFGILAEYSTYSNGSPAITRYVEANQQIFYTSATERMRITAAGDVGIGTSTPSTKLGVVGGINATGSIFSVNAATEASIGVAGQGTAASYMYSNSSAWGLYSTVGGSIINYARTGGLTSIAGTNVALFTTVGETARAGADGAFYVGYTTQGGTFTRLVSDSISVGNVGTSSTTARLRFAPATSGYNVMGIFNTAGASGGGLQFYTGDGTTIGANTRLMQLTTGGQLLVGNYTSPVADAPATALIQCAGNIYTSGRMLTGGTTQGWVVGAEGTGANSFIVYNYASAGVYIGYGATSWTANSDERLKNVTGTYDNALSGVMQLKPIKFTWKADDTNKPCVGVIAQSVLPVVPEAIDEQSISGRDDDTPYLGVRYTELIPIMIAAIQELKTELDATKARLTAAEEQILNLGVK